MGPEARNRRLAGRIAGLTIVFVLFGGWACRPEEAHEHATPGVAPPLPAPTAVDANLDDRFAFIAGRSVGRGAYTAWEGEPAWREFANETDAAWTAFDAQVLGPMRTWAAADLAPAREQTRTVFYPFGGPDLATALALFPDAPVTVLLGLEPAGNLPEFDRLTEDGRAQFFADLGRLATEFLTRGYFITMDMMDAYSNRHLDGALPVIGFFLKRAGFSVVGVRRLQPADDGSWQEVSYARSTVRPRRPYGVRIDCFRPGDPSPRTVYYFSCNIENTTFTEGSLLHRFFAGLERPTTFVKAGSYLLHWNNFSTLRQLILDRSLYVLQDDTAVPYRYFVKGGWTVTLFGRYATPVKDFTNVEQPDLRAAYEAPDAEVRALPFRFGYRWRSRIDNLMLAERPRRPYKVPVEK